MPARRPASISSRAAAALLGLVMVPAGAARAAEAPMPLDEPFAWRDLTPIGQLYGLPRARDARLPDEPTIDLLVERTSNATEDVDASRVVVMDGETTLVTLRGSLPLGERHALEVELPWVNHAAGDLDSFVDRWHDWFGFPEGERRDMPSSRLLYLWQEQGVDRVRMTRSRSGVGDLRLALTRQLRSGPDQDLAVRLGLKLPTGDADDLTGSGGTDLSVGVHLSRPQLLRSLSSHASAGLLLIGDDDVAASDREAVVGWASWTLALPIGERLQLKGQLDWHSDLVDADTPKVGGWALAGGLGGALRLGPGLVLELAVYEDLRPAVGPDVSFQLALRGRL